jgi:hypothetical protein
MQGSWRGNLAVGYRTLRLSPHNAHAQEVTMLCARGLVMNIDSLFVGYSRDTADHPDHSGRAV